MFDRNPLLPLTADKYRAREYVTRVLGAARAAEVLVPLFHVTDDPDTIPFDDLPGPCIVKPNHGSGWTVIVDQNGPARKDVVEACRRWLETPYGIPQLEWAYRDIERRILVEHLLQDERGGVPTDYKFFMFDGECAFVQVDEGRFGRHTRGLFSPAWKRFRASHKYPPCGNLERPPHLEEMLAVAGKLGAGFDFVRVDLYSTLKGIFFGELTHYPATGVGRFTPRSFDFWLGERWRIG
jgi:hypothetical protein